MLRRARRHAPRREPGGRIGSWFGVCQWLQRGGHRPGPPVAEPPPPEPKPDPVPQPKPEPAPVPKPSPVKAPPKPAPAKKEKITKDLIKDLKPTPAKEKKPTGARLGSDFLKGITAEKTGGKSQKPRAALSGIQMRSIVSVIAQQVRPCYRIPTGGVDTTSVVSVLHLKFNEDGSVAGTPSVVDHEGVTGSNQGYVRQMDEAAIRAVIQCSPLKGLPPDLYEGGWEDITFYFRPQAMQ